MDRNKRIWYKRVLNLVVIVMIILWALGLNNLVFSAVGPPPGPGPGPVPDPFPEPEPESDYYYWDISGVWTVEVHMSEWGYDPEAELPVLISEGDVPPPRYSMEMYYGTMTLDSHSSLYFRTLGFMDITSIDNDHQIVPVYGSSKYISYAIYPYYVDLRMDERNVYRVGVRTINSDGTQIQGGFEDPNPPPNRSILWGFTAYGQAKKIFYPVVLKPEDKIGGTPIFYLDKIPLSEENYTSTSNIPFKAKLYGDAFTGEINWKTGLKWEPSPKRSPLIETKTFSTISEEEHYEKYLSMGGGLGISATANLKSTFLPLHAKWLPSGMSVGYIMVTGPEGGIPKDKITTRLVELYKDGATPRLMTGIAMIESSYMQFYKHNFNYPDLWMPRVSDDSGDGIWGNENDGSHVGLMQMDIRRGYVSDGERWQRAWDWLINTQEGVNFFKNEKIRLAKAMERKIIKDFLNKNPDLGAEDIEQLNAVGVENMALVLYGPHAAYGKIDKQYYILVRENEKGVWKENTNGNPEGIAYAKKVHGKIIK